MQQELRGILLRAVASLPEHYRLVFRVRYIGEASTADTASRLGITEQCVKTRLLRARRILQKKIRGGLPAAPLNCEKQGDVRLDAGFSAVFGREYLGVQRSMG